MGGMSGMKDQRKAEDVAVQRFQLLSPLLTEGLDSARVRELKQGICEQTGLSERTLRRYLAEYRSHGFSGLRPKGKGRKPTTEAIPIEVMEQAILLRREAPSRSVSQIIQILEWEGKVSPGTVKRSTLQEKLAQRGYSSRQMRMYTSKGVSARRFQRRQRNALWQSDIKYGPYLPIGPNGTNKQVYLVLFMDDATRFVLHGQWYASLDQSIVEDCFRKAISKYGIPDAVYFDNGKQYRTKWMGRTCSKLGIRLLFTKPYAPESKGKVERLNGVIQGFLNEQALEKPKTLDQLNAWFDVWLGECHQAKPHSALDQLSPEVAYRQDPQTLRFVEPDVLADAFLHVEERKVDKVGCISFRGKKYEVGLTCIGQTVTVIYDPAEITEITIELEGHEPRKAREMVIGERAGQRPALPESLLTKEADHSRLLQSAKQKQMERKQHQAPAVSYRTVHKEVGKHV